MSEELDDSLSFVQEDRQDEANEKTSPFARKKRAIIRSLIRRNRPHREDVLPVRAKASRRANQDEEGIEVDSTFFWSEEEVERRQAMGSVRCALP